MRRQPTRAPLRVAQARAPLLDRRRYSLCGSYVRVVRTKPMCGGLMPELQNVLVGLRVSRSASCVSVPRHRLLAGVSQTSVERVPERGDLGQLDAERRLRLVGHKKEMIIPPHGVNVARVQIESALDPRP